MILEKFDIKKSGYDSIKTKHYIDIESDKRIKLYCCPYCHYTEDSLRVDNESENKDDIIEHMEACQDNPMRISYYNKCKEEYERLFKGFGFSYDCNTKPDISTKLQISKIVMIAAFYHKTISDPIGTVYQMAMVTHETKNAYLGTFLEGIKMYNVIFPKKPKNVRYLNIEERDVFMRKYLKNELFLINKIFSL